MGFFLTQFLFLLKKKNLNCVRKILKMLSLKRYSFKTIFVVFLVLSSIKNWSQKQEKDLLTDYDHKIGTENTPINNGALHTNPYRISNNKHRYFTDEEYTKGDVLYDSQWYYNVPLKYDLYKDVLIYKIQKESSLGIDLISQRVSTFRIYDKNFIFLEIPFSRNEKLKSGFFQEVYKNENFAFYAKNIRYRREIIKNQNLYTEFEDDNAYFLKNENGYYEIQSKKDLTKLYPRFKRQINEYYSSHNSIFKKNATAFYEAFAPYLFNLIKNNQ